MFLAFLIDLINQNNCVAVCDVGGWEQCLLIVIKL